MKELFDYCGKNNLVVEFYPARINPTDTKISWIVCVGHRDGWKFSSENKDMELAFQKTIGKYQAENGIPTNRR